MDRSRSYDESRRRRPVNNKVPAGWLDYTPLNTWIENTRLVPFKCPLRWSILRNLNQRDRFSLNDLIERLDNRKRELGLIIDLTDTDRYYDYRDVEDLDIEYCKIRVPGHQDVSDENCQKFFRIVNKFLRNNRQNNKLIGIHCTHGVNRSGYFIARYLIEILGLQPDEAIAAFNRARGHRIEKNIEDLQTRKPIHVTFSSSSSSSSSSEREDDEYYTARDRPLPYTRPSIDPTSDEISPTKSQITA
ncbi:unnamed protein product [Rotaria magnacalcarata]|uniref:RNA/RNP complex-1-interacting phosphatase n=1 Tax=Rotaria magnacalcarata TaxID=392030 RepID=A0A816P7G0_9BILA|nr:unnamed protein product [Rotaria magnacalcarata]CAF2047068.1 unnamed protein product [Rotaria magnacalcarata]CAF3754168.1 unnamed protein product [Rotaria magnacalcarata]CAF3852384.1 unnamed protein product [Rotaria magnacalcarata]